MNNLPIKFENDSIVDANIEIRFETNLNPNVVFAYIYGKVKEIFNGNVLSFPISQMPSDIIRQDSTLKYKPLYRIEGENCSLQTGSQMIALSSKIPYIGWHDFSTTFYDIVKLCFEYFKKITRLGIRYINFFEGDISDKININFNISDKYQPSKLNIQTEVLVDDIPNTIQYTPNARWKLKNGSVIDIDTFKLYSDPVDFNVLQSDVELVHKCEKTVFISLLKDELIKELRPQY